MPPPAAPSSASSASEASLGTSASELAQLLAQLHGLHERQGESTATAVQPSNVQQAQMLAALQAGMSAGQRRALHQMTQASGSQVLLSSFYHGQASCWSHLYGTCTLRAREPRHILFGSGLSCWLRRNLEQIQFA